MLSTSSNSRVPSSSEVRVKYCLLLDLVDDEESIRMYLTHHQTVWPGILSSILSSGIREMQIYRLQNRLVMLLDVDETFSFERKLQMDLDNPLVQHWEGLMAEFQRVIPGGAAGEKWRLAEPCFSLVDSLSSCGDK